MSAGLYCNIVVCESVLWESNGIPSAIRILDVLAVAQPSTSRWHARFYSLIRLHTPVRGDNASHRITVQAIGPSGERVASAEQREFKFGYAVDPSAPGGYALATEFNIDTATAHAPLGTYAINAIVDGELVGSAPLTLRKR